VALVTMPLGGKREERAGGDVRFNVIALVMLVVPVALGLAETVSSQNPAAAIIGALVGITLMQSPKVAQQWERAVILRLGRYVGLRGPGLF
jgi:regulator of protease activity HflC (stomatin/prohibitin superfamily)